jgi:hypothetical protein
MVKKTFNEKLNEAKDLPKLEFIEEGTRKAKLYGVGYMLIAAPIEYDEVMKKITEGSLITSEEIKKYLAKKHSANCTCPYNTGVSINISAYASEERQIQGSNNLTPYWRTLKKDGELNEKYPGGIDKQKTFLEIEGHTIINKGKRYFVSDYEKALQALI